MRQVSRFIFSYCSGTCRTDLSHIREYFGSGGTVTSEKSRSFTRLTNTTSQASGGCQLGEHHVRESGSRATMAVGPRTLNANECDVLYNLLLDCLLRSTRKHQISCEIVLIGTWEEHPSLFGWLHGYDVENSIDHQHPAHECLVSSYSSTSNEKHRLVLSRVQV